MVFEKEDHNKIVSSIVPQFEKDKLTLHWLQSRTYEALQAYTIITDASNTMAGGVLI